MNYVIVVIDVKLVICFGSDGICSCYVHFLLWKNDASYGIAMGCDEIRSNWSTGVIYGGSLFLEFWVVFALISVSVVCSDINYFSCIFSCLVIQYLWYVRNLYFRIGSCYVWNFVFMGQYLWVQLTHIPF